MPVVLPSPPQAAANTEAVITNQRRNTPSSIEKKQDNRISGRQWLQRYPRLRLLIPRQLDGPPSFARMLASPQTLRYRRIPYAKSENSQRAQRPNVTLDAASAHTRSAALILPY